MEPRRTARLARDPTADELPLIDWLTGATEASESGARGEEMLSRESIVSLLCWASTHNGRSMEALTRFLTRLSTEECQSSGS